jgi:hypothetical protein
MRTSTLRYDGLSVSVAAALLAGCGGSPPATTPGNVFDAVQLKRKTFEYTGSEQRLVVPDGVTKLHVKLIGAAGLDWPFYYSSIPIPGRGGRVDAEIPVKPGETLYVFVGGQGKIGAGGFNGGGKSGLSAHSEEGAFGGGASDVREGGDKLTDRILIAGGGGASGCCYRDNLDAGGSGGNKTGVAGAPGNFGGGGGSQTQGGAGGKGEGGYGSQAGQYGSNGRLGVGGNGGNGAKQNGYSDGGPGGGGGGGYYGGGGGGGGGPGYTHYYGFAGAGGGGGSSYVEPTAITSHMWQGWKDAKSNGKIVFSW